MNKRRLFLASTLIGAMSLGSYTIAGGHGSCKHGKKGGEYSEQRMEKKVTRMTEKLGLSAEQSEQMKAAMKSNHETVKGFREQMRTLHESMRSLNPDAADFDTQLGSLANQKGELVRQMTIAKGKKRQAMAKILTPEQ
ncbi:MAG: Unknown protein, partial [uncultured Thiotrichaceae bacterium]